MATYKNISINKKGGGTRTQRVQVLASGKYKFVKNPRKKSSSKSKVRKTKTKTRRNRNPVARRRKKSRRSRQFTVPIALAGGLYAGLHDSVTMALSGDYANAGRVLVQHYTGLNPTTGQWSLAELKKGVVPLLVGWLVHKFVGGTLGVNRMLGAAKVPFIRL